VFRSIGPTELLIILAIVVVLFGATRIGDIGKGIGRGIREFRHEIKEGQAEGEEKEPAQADTSQEKSYAAKAETSEEKKTPTQH